MGKLALISLALAACGGGVDLTGFYQVTAHTSNDASCEVEGAAVTDPPYIRFAKDEFFGQEFFSLSYCGGTDDTTCGGGSGLFAEEIDNGYRGEISFSSGGGAFGDCSLGYEESTAVQTETGVRVEIRNYAEEVPGLTEEACDPDEAQSRGDSMPCESFEVIVATALEAS